MDEDAASRLIEAIDVDHSGDIDEFEFVAWLEHNMSQMKVRHCALYFAHWAAGH